MTQNSAVLISSGTGLMAGFWILQAANWVGRDLS